MIIIIIAVFSLIDIVIKDKIRVLSNAATVINKIDSQVLRAQADLLHVLEQNVLSLLAVFQIKVFLIELHLRMPLRLLLFCLKLRILRIVN